MQKTTNRSNQWWPIGTHLIAKSSGQCIVVTRYGQCSPTRTRCWECNSKGTTVFSGSGAEYCIKVNGRLLWRKVRNAEDET